MSVYKWRTRNFGGKKSHKKYVKASSPGVGYTDSDPQGTQPLISANITVGPEISKGDLNTIARWLNSTELVSFFDRICKIGIRQAFLCEKKLAQ